MFETPDVCVVGAGPAGLTTALTLAAAGIRVVLLESGGFASSKAVQVLNDGDHEGYPYAGLTSTRHRQIGGTANIWNVGVQGKPGAKFVPLSARDLADWPITWDELKPFYAEAQRICGLGPFEYEVSSWATAERTPFELDGTGITNGVYQFGYANRFTRNLVDDLRAAESATVVTSAHVVALDFERGTRRLRAVRVVDGDGRVAEVKARIVVLACGAVENARLLLLAGLGEGRSERWVGRCFMEHVRDFSLALVPDSPDIFAQAGFYDLRLSEKGCLVGGRLTLTDEALDRFQLPNGSMTLVPRRRETRGRTFGARLSRPLRRALAGGLEGRYGWSAVRSPARVFDRFSVIVNLEQRPHPRNRIELSSRCDRLGNPLPRLLLHWSHEEQEALERLRELLAEWFRGAGLGRLIMSKGYLPDLNAHHHAGTTRMALQSEEGVVDPDGRVFGTDNLYLVGASVFPSAGFANPTLTIVALARRLGRHLAAQCGHLPL